MLFEAELPGRQTVQASRSQRRFVQAWTCAQAQDLKWSVFIPIADILMTPFLQHAFSFPSQMEDGASFQLLIKATLHSYQNSLDHVTDWTANLD